MNIIKEILKKILNNDIFKIALFSILIYSMLIFQSVIQPFNPISWILFVGIFVLLSKIKLYDKKVHKESLVLSLVFSFLVILGKILYTNMMNAENNLFAMLFSITNITSYVGLTILIYVLLTNILVKLINLKITNNNSKSNLRKTFIISFLIIIICWIPYFLSLYPGELSADSIAELNKINGLMPLSNHHPVIHILFVAIPYKLGVGLFNNTNIAVALSSLTQMIVMASIFSSFIVFLKKRNVNNFVIGLCTLFFALVPMNAFYSVTMWKDVIFSGLVLLLTMQIVKLYEIKNEIDFRKMISFIIISLLTLLFRNNAIYMYFLLILMILWVFKSKIKYFAISFAIIIGTYFIILHPVFDALNIKRSSSAEYIAIPLQQIGRMVYKDADLTKDEEKAINELIDINVLKKVYHPYGVDNIKFNDAYKGEVFDNNKSKYLKLWMNLVIKHPYIAVESYALSTLGYWYPGIDNWVICDGVYDNSFNIHRNSKAPNIINYFVNKMDSKSVPVFGMFWSTSLALYLIVISCVICIKKHGIKSFVFYVPVFGIWLTMMVAAPVNAEFRYIYPLYTCLPLLICLPFILNVSKNKEKRRLT